MILVTTQSGEVFEGVAGKSIVDSAISGGLFFPYSCKTGRCKTCRCQLVDGSTKLLSEELGLSDDEKASGWILGCVREAISDLTINANGVSKIVLPQVKTLPCRITSLELLNENVMRIVLRLPPNSGFHYLAGQYVNIIKDSVRRSYSIANAVREDRQVEIHVKQYKDGQLSKYWFEEAKVNDLLHLSGPLGTFFIRDCVGKNLIFLATGTGFAPVKAILESLGKLEVDARPASVRVYWGGRVQSDFYIKAPDIDLPYKFLHVLSRGMNGAHQQYVQNACLGQVSDFDNTQVFACGSGAMVEDARSLFVGAGLRASDFFSDAFVCSS